MPTLIPGVPQWVTEPASIGDTRRWTTPSLQGGQVGIHLDEAGLEPGLGLWAHEHRRHIGLMGDCFRAPVTEVVEDDRGRHATCDISFGERERTGRIELHEYAIRRVLLARLVVDHHRLEASARTGFDRDPLKWRTHADWPP